MSTNSTNDCRLFHTHLADCEGNNGAGELFSVIDPPPPGCQFNFSGGYLVPASDTICLFKLGAASLKSNGLAILNVSVPWLAGALIALLIITFFYFLGKYFV